MFTTTTFSSRTPIRPAILPRQVAKPGQPLFAGHDIDPNNISAVKALMMGQNSKLTVMNVAPKTDSPEVIKYLAEKIIQITGSIDAPIHPLNGYTLLHVVVNKGNPKVVEALLKAGANPAVPDKHGKTSLDWLDKSNSNVSQKDRQAIKNLLIGRLIELASPKAKENAPQASSWSIWPFANKAAAPSSAANALLTEANQPEPKEMVNRDTQTAPPPEFTEKELELSKSLETLRSSAKKTQQQLTESLGKLATQEERLKDAGEKEKELKRLQKENSGLQSKLQKQLEDARITAKNFEKRLTESADSKNQRGQNAQAEISKLQQENARITRDLKVNTEKSEALQAQLDAAKTEKNQASKKEQGTAKRQLVNLKAEHEKLTTALRDQNKKIQKKLDESEKSRIQIQQTSHAQITRHKEELSQAHKDLIDKQHQTQELQTKLNEQIDLLAKEKATFGEERWSQLERQRAHQLAELQKQLNAVEASNRQLLRNAGLASQHAQTLTRSLEGRIQVAEQKNVQLQDHLVAEKALRLSSEAQGKQKMDVLLADNRQLMEQLKQVQFDHSTLQERLAAAESANINLHNQLNQQGRAFQKMSHQHTQRTGAELAQARTAYDSLYRDNERLKDENNNHKSNLAHMRKMLSQSFSLNEAREQILGLAPRLGIASPEAQDEYLPEEEPPSDLVKALDLESPLTASKRHH